MSYSLIIFSSKSLALFDCSSACSRIFFNASLGRLESIPVVLNKKFSAGILSARALTLSSFPLLSARGVLRSLSAYVMFAMYLLNLHDVSFEAKPGERDSILLNITFAT